MNEMTDTRRSTSRFSPALRKGLAIAFQALILFFGVTGVAILLADVKTIAGALNFFSYYTIQSNLFVAASLVLGIWGLIKGREDTPLLVIFKSGVMLWILVTGIVYHLLLSGSWQPRGPTFDANLMVHYLTPIGMLLVWLIFEKKGRYKAIYALYWLSYPFLYILFSWLRGWLTGNYIYWFFNPTRPYPDGAGSLGAMLLIVGILSLGFYGIGLLIVLVDKLLARCSSRVVSS
jgi:hypothetical protein